MSTRYLGLDVHKAYIHGFVFAPGERGRHFRFANTPAEWERFLATVTADDHVALEATTSAFPRYDRIVGRAGKVLVAHPLGMRRLGSGRHTDRVDAERLAQMLALGTLPTVWVPPPPVRELRRLLTTRERIQNQVTRLTNEIRAALRAYGLDGYRRGADLLRVLRPDDVAALPDAEQFIVRSALRRLEVARAERAACEAAIARRVRDVPEVRRLLTLTGVSLIVAAQLYAAFGDARRFRSPKQVTRYFGLDPSVVQSGQRHTLGHISRNGNRQTRWLLVEAAQSAARHDTGPLGAFYRRIVIRLGPKKACVALAKKLAILAWRLLVTGSVYRGMNPQRVQKKIRRLEQQARDATTHPASSDGTGPPAAATVAAAGET
jgi:transposase